MVILKKLIRKIKTFNLIIVELFYRLKNTYKIYDTKTTLQKMVEDGKSICRFGDGEFNLILGDNLKFQPYSKDLSFKLKNVLKDKDNNKNCLIAIPYAMSSLKGFTIKSKVFWLKYCAIYRKQIMSLLSTSYMYSDSQVSRVYINRQNKEESVEYFKMWKNIWEDKNVIIFEGNLSRFGVGNTLLDTAKSVHRIICPSENAFAVYDKIYKTALEMKNDADLFLFSLGPTATCLAYEISKEGIQCIDTGNMDMEYEWSLRNVKKKVQISNKYSLEAKNGTHVTECNDELYLKQIIKII